MNRILIRAVGGQPSGWPREAIQTYLERLRPFAQVEILEIEEGHGGASKPDPAKTKKIEGERLLKNLPEHATVIALDETGAKFDSPTFAKRLSDWTNGGQMVVFLVGGSWGLDPSVRERANAVLSFGKATLPHALARIVLLEQLYRAEMIMSGKTYHK